MRRPLFALVLICFLTAGCVGGPDGASTYTTEQSSANETTTPELTPAVELPPTGAQCDESLQVSYWGLNEDRRWTQDSVRVSYFLPANTSVLYVTYIDGTVQGVSVRNSPQNDGLNGDGDRMELATSLSGSHVVRTVVYRDTNGNGAFEKDVDKPCFTSGDIVQAGPEKVSFTRFE